MKKIIELIEQEKVRQEMTVNLIASENYAEKKVLDATGSVLTNKYAEGYPGKRYYAGCQTIDEIETIAIECAKELFGAEHANVQPHCGSNANLAVYFAVLNPGDTVLAMSLNAGGHLTHGHPINISGKFFNFVSYGVDRITQRIDYDEVEKLAAEHKPKLLVVGASAYSRHIDYERMAAIAKKHGAYMMTDMAHVAGLVAADLHPNPVAHSDFVTSTTHKTLRGPRGGLILCKEKYKMLIDKAVMPGTQGGPLMHTIAAKGICFYNAAQFEFKIYQEHVLENAKTFAQAFIDRGYDILSGGTDNHLFVIDFTRTHPHLTGKHVEQELEKVNILVNRNMIPFDTRSPLQTSGIRIGTPAMTSRAWQAKDFVDIAHQMDKIINNLKPIDIPPPLIKQVNL
jgi:glycine hydroxymethyltransferase